MRDFAAATYNKVVLAPYMKGGMPDPFERYLLDLDDDDEDSIEQRMEAVYRYWNNHKTDPPPIGPLVTSMVKDHRTLLGQLQDRSERRELAAGIQSERDRAEAERLRGIETALRQLHRDHGGIPDELREEVVAIGTLAGLTEAEARHHIDVMMRREGWTRVAIASATRIEPLSDNLARQLRQQLRRFEDTRRQELGRAGEVRSLFEAFDLQFDADPASCQAAILAMEESIRREVRSASDYAAASRNVIEAARAHLTGDGDIARYRATVMRDVMDEIEPQFRAFAIDGSVDRNEFEQLVMAAAEGGLPNRFARDAVDALFRKSAERGHPVEREVGERVTLILCANCRAPDFLESGHEQCLKCGEPLYRECENCHSSVPRGEAVCRSCGHSVLTALQVDVELRAAREALKGGRPEQARRRATEALRADAASTEAQQLKSEADAAVAATAESWKTLAAAIAASNLYTARSRLRGLVESAMDVEGPSGDIPGEALTRIESELRVVEDRIVSARGLAAVLERERAFAAILAQVADCDEARRELSRIPPAPAAHVEAELVAGGVRITWSPSSAAGVSGYVVVRGDGQAPRLPEDGTRVAETSGTTVSDTTAAAGQTVAYSVFAVRAGITSPAASSVARVVALEASDVVATVDSGEVRLSWRLPTSRAAVEIERQSSDGQCTQVLAGPDGLIDTGLVNGSTYRYTVRLRYGEVITAGVQVVANPSEPPKPVSLLGLEAVAEGVAMTWHQPQNGSVIICRSATALDLASGTEIRRDALPAMGQALPGGSGKATDASPIDGCWYTPITLSGDRAVVGSGLRWTDIAAVTDVKAEENGGEVRVTWNWPPGVKHAMVLWREGGTPEGLDDPDAHTQHVARAIHQEVNGGVFRIKREQPNEVLRLAVYGAQMRDGELIVGARLAPSSRASVDAAFKKAAISYGVKINRGLRGKSLEVTLTGGPSFPEVVLIAKAGEIIPLHSDDGQTLARLGGDGAPERIALSLSSLPRDRPLAVRAFLAADSSKTKYSLREPADLTTLILR